MLPAPVSDNEFDPKELERVFKVNIISCFHLVKAALDHMQPGSSIINTSSTSFVQPCRGALLDYTTTKAAIVAFTKFLSPVLMQKGIRVNAVAPGPVCTPLVVSSADTKRIATYGQFFSTIGRAAQPVEIASAFVSLASPEDTSYVSGEVFIMAP